MVSLDEDAVKACAHLVGRTGARQFQVGFLHDDVPPEQAGWYAYAQYPGTRIQVGDMPGPAEACEALARKLLEGAKCMGCGGLATLTDAGAIAHPGRMADGSTITAEQAQAMQHCRWTRMGARWVAGCKR